MEYIQVTDVLYFMAIPFIFWFSMGIISTVLGALVIMITARIAGYCEAKLERVLYGDEYTDNKQQRLEEDYERACDEWPASRWFWGIITSIIHWPTWIWAVAEQASENTDIIVHSIKQLRKYAN